jgi:DNA-directed RNA polymerase subunit M/transcription elongation factor TFIIS
MLMNLSQKVGKILQKKTNNHLLEECASQRIKCPSCETGWMYPTKVKGGIVYVCSDCGYKDMD